MGKTRGYSVAISIAVSPDGKLGLFENGLKQNVLFLYHLFAASRNCESVYLVQESMPPGPYEQPLFGVDPDHVVDLTEVSNKIDYLIALGVAISHTAMGALKERGCGLILYKGGNGGILTMEATASVPPKTSGEFYVDHRLYDQIWVTSQHMPTYRSWCETVYRCPVISIPQIWTPALSSIVPVFRQEFGFAPPKKPWRIGIMDPNNTMMKTSHMPMLVAAACFDKKPSIIEHVYVTNTLSFIEDDHFQIFSKSLKISAAKKLTIEPRFVGYQFLANHTDAVITHHWEIDLNYLYYEVLFGKYPLIHNSEPLRDYGYYYESFNPESGAEALILAHRTHANSLEEYDARNAELFKRLDPTNPDNIAFHENLMFKTGRSEDAKGQMVLAR